MIWSDSTSVAGLTISSAFNGILSITNNGFIIGKGGAGATVSTYAVVFDGEAGGMISRSYRCHAYEYLVRSLQAVAAVAAVAEWQAAVALEVAQAAKQGRRQWQPHWPSWGLGGRLVRLVRAAVQLLEGARS